MVSLPFLTTAAIVLASVSHAHFTIETKPMIDFVDEGQSEGPCGGYEVDLATAEATDFYASGDYIGTTTSHAQGNWLYRITTDSSASGNWTQIYPIIMQMGMKEYCTPGVEIPSEFVGRKAVLGVVSSTGHGMLFGCSAINVVNGTAGARPEECFNATSVTGMYTTDSSLAALVEGGSESGSNTSTPSGTHDDHSESTETPSVGSSTYGHSERQGVIPLVLSAMLMLGAALMI